MKWLYLNFVGFLSEKQFWVGKRLEGGETRENRMCLKICHISLIKLKTRVFRKLPSLEATCKKYLWSTKLFTGRLYLWNSCEIVAIASVLKLCFFSFCLKIISREELGCEIVATQSRYSLYENEIFRFLLNSFCGKLLDASFSRKCLWTSFWRTTQKCILNKN